MTVASARCGFAAQALPAPIYLVSIHTRFADLILDGAKDVELRRRFARGAAGGCILIYATMPTAAVLGRVRIRRVDDLPLDQLWNLHGASSAIDRSGFDRYFFGLQRGLALVLSEPLRFKQPIALSELRERHRLSAPQSYAILRGAHGYLWGHEQD